jgi:hypothetical protein
LKNVKNALAKQSASGASLPWAMWIWNRNITGPEVEKQVNALISKGFGGIAIRPGRDMFPAYLSQEFMDNFGIALEIARQHKVSVRLADDFSLLWGGEPESCTIGQSRKLRAEYLVLDHDIPLAADENEVDVELDPESEYIAQAIRRGTGKAAQTVDIKQVTIPAGKSVFNWKSPGPDWRLIIYRKEAARCPSGSGIPNVLNSKAVQNYMQNVLEVIKSNFSRYVPTTFEGFITEMPALRPGNNAIYWDEDIAVKYKSRYKRDFMGMLPYLFLDLPGAERLRVQAHTFIFSLITEKFAAALDTWAKRFRLSQWLLWPEVGMYKLENALCDGYVPPEASLTTLGLQNLDGSLDNFALLRAAADVNTNQYRRETVTVIGRNRQAAGSGLQDLKREIDLSLLAGPSRILIDGIYFNTEQRNSYKTPFGPSWYSPEWEHAHLLCAYSARLQEMVAGLSTSREVAVLSPTDGVMGDYLPSDAALAGEGIARFQRTVNALCCFGKGFDVVTEDLLLSCTLRQSGDFATADRIRKGNYQALVVPYAPFVTRRLLVFLEKLAIKGTTLVFIDETPKGTLEDGASDSVIKRIQNMAHPRRENVSIIPASDLDQALSNIKPEAFLLRESGESADVGIQVYHGEGGKLYMLHSMLDSAEQTVIAEVQADKHFTAVNITTGELTEIEPFEIERNTARLRLTFSPLETMFIVSSAAPMAAAEPEFNPFALPSRSYRIIFKEQWEFEPMSANVLPLSNWNVRMGLSRESGQISHFYEAAFDVKEAPESCIFVMNGLSRSVAPAQGLEISINGIRVDDTLYSDADPAWREKLPLKLFEEKTHYFEIGDKIAKGLNRVSLRTTGSAIDPQTLIHPPFITGGFAIVKGGHGLAIDRQATMAGHDSWTKHGYPYMSGRARYTQVFEVPNDYDKVVLRFSSVSGTVYVKINDVDVGTLYWPPMEMDVTKFCNVQRNTLSVEVVNTIDNALRLNARPSGLTGEVYIDVYKS